MRFAIEPRAGYLQAELLERDTAEEMREFLFALRAACRDHEMPKVLISVRRSRAVFKPEDYGLGGYASELVTPACQIALLGDTGEVNSANEYLEVVARGQGVNLRAFRDAAAARRWLRGAERPARRYRFTRIVISGAPDDAGVFSLWEGEELIYYGRADGGETIRSRLLAHYYESPRRPTHYSWELCRDPAAREAELLAEHERRHGRRPRLNHAA